jgi:hypothetical protein
MAFLVFSVNDSNEVEAATGTDDTLGVTSRTGDAVTKLPRCDAGHATDDEVLNEVC